jgi:hypothetical protein
MSVNWEALGAIANLLAALGVIATLIYLAIQIRQNNIQLRGSATIRNLRLSTRTDRYADRRSRALQNRAAWQRRFRFFKCMGATTLYYLGD